VAYAIVNGCYINRPAEKCKGQIFIFFGFANGRIADLVSDQLSAVSSQQEVGFPAKT
jgi:hypothetical protein